MRYILHLLCLSLIPSSLPSQTLWDQLKDKLPATEKHMAIIVPSYNNKDWYQKNLDSIFNQNYSNYTIYYFDDCSSDGTSDLVREYARKHNQSHRLILTTNTVNIGGLGNIYHGVHACKDNDIVINLDGDDWFNGTNVLSLLNAVYEDPDVWFTYGQFTNWPFQPVDEAKPVPNHIIQSGKYRGRGWEKPLRTWRAWLFKKIKKSDLMHQGSFFKTSWDHAFMLPMFEMAAGRFKFIPDILYVYNRANQICDDKIRRRQQMADAGIIHRKTPYKKLDKSPESST